MMPIKTSVGTLLVAAWLGVIVPLFVVSLLGWYCARGKIRTALEQAG